jgi:GR25 family glycosyltransferase involved in LPS biosynthesis
MKAYVINLKSRSDRWKSVTDQWSTQKLSLIRIDAVDANSISCDLTHFLPNPVVANWLSQREAFKAFLQSEDHFALILEDDFVLKYVDLDECLDLVKRGSLDFLQLGYLYNSYTDFLLIKMANLRDFTLKILNKVLINFSGSFANKLLIREQSNLSFKVVLNHAGSGSHAYIISRKFAEEMLQINTPVFLAADGLFISIANLRFLRMGRLRANRVRQSNSPSSITKRFVTKED